MSARLIVALDDPDLPKAEALAREIGGSVDALKVGLTLFSAYGPEAIMEIAQHAPVFCDLKLHDIPHQVAAAAAELSRQSVWMFTVHASGGAEMVRAAVRAAGERPTSPLVAAVTVLTSLDAAMLEAVGQAPDPLAQVVRLARLSVDAGASAIVCSPHEIEAVRAEVPDTVKIVTPGIRPRDWGRDDQARTMTPLEAARASADYVVVGRPVTAAADPAAAAAQIKAELAA